MALNTKTSKGKTVSGDIGWTLLIVRFALFIFHGLHGIDSGGTFHPISGIHSVSKFLQSEFLIDILFVKVIQ